MQTLRFNPFSQIHKGLRALLYDTALLIQHTDFTKEEEIRKITDRVHFVNETFATHAHVEDHQVFPMIAEFAPEVVTDFESQHQTDHELSEGLQKCLNLFTETNSPEQNLWAGNELLQAFNSFLAFNVEHMKKEETIINAVLWEHYSDAQLLQKVQQISASMPIEENMSHSIWMLKGLAVYEIITWYKDIQQAAPPFVFENFCQLAEKTLTPARWNRVKAVL
jgi:Hemerythrin HHE cation binding domain